MSRVMLKDPAEVEAYTFDYNDAAEDSLAPGETISTSGWAVDTGSGDGQLAVDSDSETTTTATVKLSAGTKGQVYQVKNTVVTSQSRTLIRRLTVRVGLR